MDRGRRAEPYSNATIWTREIARNLAGHLSRVSKAHSCVDTRSPKSTRLPQFHNSFTQKRCSTSPMKTRQPLMTITRNSNPIAEQKVDFRGIGGCGEREETDPAQLSNHNPEIDHVQHHDAKQELVHRRIKTIPHHHTNSELEINQEVSDRQVRIPAVKPPAKQHFGNGNASDMATYDAPLILPQQKHRLSHDYYKKQEQRKIWQENQALNKRLQSTKATLNSKEWEKDGKWTQEFLKNQERRRSALRQELCRAQASPQAVLRSKPLKSLHPHHLKSTHHHVDSDNHLDLACSDVAGSLSARDLVRRGSKGQELLDSRDSSGVIGQQASAANHRRIVKLRKQKPAPSCSVDVVESSSTEKTAAEGINPANSGEQAAFIRDNEIVAVRFTFSRGRSHGTDLNTSNIERPDPLQVDGGDRDVMSLSGAYSPGIELESALNANDNQRQRGQLSGTVAGTVDEDSQESAAGLSGNAGETLVAEGGGEAEIESGVEATDPSIESEDRRSTLAVEAVHTQSDEEEEAYDGDNFDDDALPSSRAVLEHHEATDKHDASGYASEFDEEPGGDIHDNVPGATPTDNQEDDKDEEEDDASYSHDFD